MRFSMGMRSLSPCADCRSSFNARARSSNKLPNRFTHTYCSRLLISYNSAISFANAHCKLQNKNVFTAAYSLQ